MPTFEILTLKLKTFEKKLFKLHSWINKMAMADIDVVLLWFSLTLGTILYFRLVFTVACDNEYKTKENTKLCQV